MAAIDKSQAGRLSLPLLLLVASCLLHEVMGHGMLMDPVNRSSAWKKGFKTPRNWDDNQIYCGGIGVQYGMNDGKCGVCGDAYNMPRPRPNENGGKYGRGVIVKSYKPGEKITATVEIDTNHLGYFKFALCPLNTPKELETEECFAKHPVLLANGDTKFELLPDVWGDVKVELQLPAGLTCQHCVLRWHWRTANNWGDCKKGGEALGCGEQEHWRTCSDISIV